MTSTLLDALGMNKEREQIRSLFLFVAVTKSLGDITASFDDVGDAADMIAFLSIVTDVGRRIIPIFGKRHIKNESRFLLVFFDFL